MLHLVELYVRRGEVGRAQPFAARFLAAQPDSVLAKEVELLVACARNGPSAVTWTREAAVHPLGVLEAARHAGVESGAACAEAGFDAVVRGYPASRPDAVTYRWPALVGLQSVLLARGDVAGARARLDSAIAEGLGGGTLYLLDATLTPLMADRARAVAQQDSTRYGATYERATSPTRLWHLGVWEAASGRPTVAATIARNLQGRAAADGAPADSLLARSVAARAALAAARSRADSGRVIDSLTALLAAPGVTADVAWNVQSARAGERLLLARALAARGDYRQAIDVASVFDSMSQLAHLLYLPSSLELRESAARALHDGALAEGLRVRLAALHGGR
jgi:hypothetical protein